MISTPVAERTLDVLSEDEGHAASGVSWGAIFAGAAGAAALSYILVILGFGLGLSSVSPWTSTSHDLAALGIATIVWLAFTQIAASAMGGYIAGRLRVKWSGVHTDEVYFRDTAHGFLSWAVASLLVAAFLASAVGTVLGGGAKAVGSLASGAGSAVASAASAAADEAGVTPDYFVDTAFRTALPTDADTSAAAQKAEAARIFVNDLTAGDLTAADKQYLGQIVAKRTGLDQAAAEERVNSAFATMKQTADAAKAKAKQVADDARKASAHAALWTFVALLSGAFFASLAATLGGRRRDLVVRSDARVTR